MEISVEEKWLQRVKNNLPELLPRPDSGHWWLDILFLIFVGVVQLAIVPTFIWSGGAIDLMTPWLVIAFVRQTNLSAFVLTLVGASILETHSSIPAGVYFCAYWILLNSITLIRSTFSWRHKISWLVTFALAEMWVILFEVVVAVFRDGLDAFSWQRALMQILRFMIAVGTGMYLWFLRSKWHDGETIPE